MRLVAQVNGEMIHTQKLFRRKFYLITQLISNFSKGLSFRGKLLPLHQIHFHKMYLSLSIFVSLNIIPPKVLPEFSADIQL